MKYASKSGKFKNTSVNVYPYSPIPSPGLIITIQLHISSGFSFTLGLCCWSRTWASGDNNHDSPCCSGNCSGNRFCGQKVKSEPRLPELGYQSCHLLSVGVGWGTRGRTGSWVEGLLNCVCFSLSPAIQGRYVIEFYQNVRLDELVFRQIPELRLIREQACREAAWIPHAVSENDLVKICPLPIQTRGPRKGYVLK